MTNKLNYARSQMYVGFQRNGNGSHTMGNMFVDVLKESKPYVVVIYIQRHCTFYPTSLAICMQTRRQI